MKTKIFTFVTTVAFLGASALHGSLFVQSGVANLLIEHDGTAWLVSTSEGASAPTPFAGLTLEMNDPLFREVGGIDYRVTPAAGTTVTNPMVPTEPEFVLQVGDFSGAGLINAILTLNVAGSTFTPKNSVVAESLDSSGADFIMYRDLPASSPTALSTATGTLAYSFSSNSVIPLNLGFSEVGTYDLAFTLIGLNPSLDVTTFPFEMEVIVPEASNYALFFGFFATVLVVAARRSRVAS